MGAYNILHTTVDCPSCKREVNVAIQFKFGDTYQHEYALGDEVCWGGNDIGPMGKSHVVVDGVAEEPCPRCGQAAERDFYIHVEIGRFTRADLADGTHDFVQSGETFIVLRD
jgi:endogenous inhibitor of DNA gyrase (YacG/DUF329 family)